MVGGTWSPPRGQADVASTVRRARARDGFARRYGRPHGIVPGARRRTSLIDAGDDAPAARPRGQRPRDARAASCAISATRILLHDPIDPEPFWNRLEAHPLAGRRRRLRSAADRDPGPVRHARPAAAHLAVAAVHDAPGDLVERLSRTGSEDVGAGLPDGHDATPIPPHGAPLAPRTARRRRRAAARAVAGARPPTSLADDIVSVLLRRVRRRAGPPRRASRPRRRPRSATRASPITWSASTASRPRSRGGRRSMGSSYLSSIGTVDLGPRARARASSSRRPRPPTPSRPAASGSISASSPTTRSPSGCTSGAGFEMLGDAGSGPAPARLRPSMRPTLADLADAVSEARDRLATALPGAAGRPPGRGRLGDGRDGASRAGARRGVRHGARRVRRCARRPTPRAPDAGSRPADQPAMPSSLLEPSTEGRLAAGSRTTGRGSGRGLVRATGSSRPVGTSGHGPRGPFGPERLVDRRRPRRPHVSCSMASRVPSRT